MTMDAPEAERMTFGTSEEETGSEDLAAWLAQIRSETTGATRLPAPTASCTKGRR
jgi:hypothetical protein